MPVIAQLRTEQVKSLLGPEPYFGQGEDEGRTLTLDEVTPFTESARQRGPRIVFLGLLDSLSSLNALPTSDFTDPERAVAKLEGIPYFAFDIGELGVDADIFLNQDKDNQVLSWQEARTVLMGLQLDQVSSALFNQARSMVDWNQRNKVCRSLFPEVSTDQIRSFVRRAALLHTLCGAGGKYPVRLYFHGLIILGGNPA
jgi:NAD+ diphosphatase